ncbi:hypothetical protein [Micromonospora sp. HK10]|uniref:hypothetical protein n=1 Tax=Micromonospora sp. HK10 TaxID=1538294 RepID=UPI000AF03630
MARRGWGASIATALGVAAGAGAAQLGFGYGLGILNWAPGDAPVEAAWVASLAWATWISATSVVAGAVCADRLPGDDPESGRTLRHLTLAVAAGVGALVTVLLVAVPARAAQVPDTFAPQTVAAGYAALGLLIGLLLAVWALHSRAAATNLIATTGWLWLLAVVSVVDGVLSGRGLGTAQLGIWQISADSGRYWIRDYFYWPGALLAMGSAVVIGALAARRTARLAERRVGAAASGAAGPILVALAYLLAVPRLAGISPEQVSAHLIAPYAVITGIAGSALVAALAQRAELRAATRAGVPLPRQRAGEPEQHTGHGPGGTDAAVRDGHTGHGPGRRAAEVRDDAAPVESSRPRWRLFGRRSAGTGAPADAPAADALAADATPADAAGLPAGTSGGTATPEAGSGASGPSASGPSASGPSRSASGSRSGSGKGSARTGASGTRPVPAGPDAASTAGATTSTESAAPARPVGDRGRAVPPQRRPMDAALAGADDGAPDPDGPADGTGTAGGSEQDGTAPATGGKARRRSR